MNRLICQGRPLEARRETPLRGDLASTWRLRSLATSSARRDQPLRPGSMTASKALAAVSSLVKSPSCPAGKRPARVDHRIAKLAAVVAFFNSPLSMVALQSSLRRPGLDESTGPATMRRNMAHPRTGRAPFHQRPRHGPEHADPSGFGAKMVAVPVFKNDSKKQPYWYFTSSR